MAQVASTILSASQPLKPLILRTAHVSKDAGQSRTGIKSGGQGRAGIRQCLVQSRQRDAEGACLAADKADKLQDAANADMDIKRIRREARCSGH